MEDNGDELNNWEQEVELEGKRREDYNDNEKLLLGNYERVWVEGVVIVGAGPSGLAAAACLKSKGIPSLILERSHCVASMWQHKTYDRLRLHLPKQFCQLPLFPFPSNFPSYPSKHHFLSYLHSYSLHFNLSPSFHTTVLSAHFHPHLRHWLLLTRHSLTRRLSLFLAPSLVVATGENADALLPHDIPGLRLFRTGPVLHTSAYKTGSVFRGKDVLVVGCGNSGMEVCLDLCNHNARAWVVVRDTVHVLPREMFGKSTFGLSMCLLKWLPVKVVDGFLLLMSRIMLGDTARFGLPRPKIGPLQMKNVSGKTPVLDVGTLAHIKSGKIKVCRGISRVTEDAVEFVDGKVDKFDAIILATGYKSSVPSWLKGSEMFNEKDGMPRKAFPNGWKGENGLYAVGFTKRGLLGASMDAMRIAQDIERTWKPQHNI